MTIIQQLKGIKTVAQQNLHKNPEYFRVLIDEIDLKLMEIENETLGHIHTLEMVYDDLDHFDMKEIG